jgi:serine/threonine protein kinase
MLSPDKKAALEVADEIDLLSRLDHRNIVKLLGVSRSSGVENYIVMEYCCPLPRTEGNEPLVGNVFRQCCSAVEYMHNLGIAHRDVKVGRNSKYL